MVKVELQAGAQSRPLMNTDANAPIASFSGAENLDWIVSHELKEPGVHYMICTASYLDGNGEEKRVRQCFKFNVQKPVLVNTRMQMCANSIYLEHLGSTE